MRSRHLSTVAAALFLGACSLLGNDLAVTYDLDPQEFQPDFGAQGGTLPNVDCSAKPDVCTQVKAPAGTTASCDAATKRCVLDSDVRLVQTINLSTQKTFPTQVTNSSAVKQVVVNAIRYWTTMNSLTFDTPPLDLYVGPQTAKTEHDGGVAKLGSMPSIPAGKLPACGGGQAGTRAGACTLPLGDAGRAALATLARDYKTPFNLLVVAHVRAQAGQPVPSGKLDLFVQPQIAFLIPL